MENKTICVDQININEKIKSSNIVFTKDDMFQKFRKFLYSMKVNDKENYNFVSLSDPIGKYRIEREHLDEFWTYVCDIAHRYPEIPIGLAEPMGNELPIIADIDPIAYVKDITGKRICTEN